ncbi:hypothetical protein Q9R08_08465 [Microbacterium sp. QXD-8]|uniref:Uncharacterized protein n=1 Tax=Microbacterium psychrotolerans TaxID=3068321 RepID=A0ABU0Z097_9MICO|nr:hypothetical protein [Microbacterium sp. QXD-8]MDQ7878001.1 hypothetical protein [Microbacterium sp. QXD-8]
MRTRVTAAALGAILVMALAGCATPQSTEPTPTPAFSSEEEAFAAAEATYRAYVDALNQVDLSDPETFEDLYGWTVGELNASDRKQFAEWHAQELTKSGEAKVQAVTEGRYDPESGEVAIQACYDVSGVDILNAEGGSVVSSDRPDQQPLAITLTPSPDSATGFAIMSISALSDEATC